MGKLSSRLAAFAVLSVVSFSVPAVARAQPLGNTLEALPPVPSVPISITNLLVRLEGRDEVGFANVDYRIHLIEHLRARGFNAVGAENLLFEKDESRRAAFRIGGIVRELQCVQMRGGTRCAVGVEWQVLDVARDAVAYAVLTRSAVYDIAKDDVNRIGSRLLIGSLDSLLVRPEFRTMLEKGAPQAADPTFASAAFARCAPSDKRMPEASERVLQATVLVRTSSGHGSGFFLTPDGLVLTAAHVLSGPTATLRLRDGTEVGAIAIRVAHQADVALLRPTQPLTAPACLAVSGNDAPTVGAELYAAGAPAREALAFTLTRGILSAVRDVSGQRVLQTDASVSPGNSGGPIVDAGANVVAITQWKLSGAAVEGVAFGTPTSRVLATLGLTPYQTTESSLHRAPPAEPAASTEVLRGTPDAPIVLDPDGDRRRAQAAAAALEIQRRTNAQKAAEAREEARDRKTSTYLDIAFYGGVTLGVGGTLAVLMTTVSAAGAGTTHRGFDTLRLVNTAGWAGLAVGTAGVVSYYVYRPPLDPAPTAPVRTGASLSFGPTGVRLDGVFE